PEAAQMIARFGDDPGFNRLGTLVARSNPGDHDYPEAVYNGIVQAIRSANWNPRYTKFVIVIGDHGNHPVPDEVNVTVKDASEPRGMTAKTVADAIDQQFVVFQAINVNRRQQWVTYNNLFEAQMNKTLDLTRFGLDNNGRRGIGAVRRLAVDDPRDADRA